MGQELYRALWETHIPDIIDLWELYPAGARLQLPKDTFTRAGNRDEQNYTFRLELKDNIVCNNISGSAVARDLASVILNNPTLRERLSGKNVVIRMDQNFTVQMSDNL
jgi:hypothetical protein